MNEIISVKEMIERAVSKSGTLRISIIKGAWQGITGELSLKSEPLGIKDAVLYVAVENSICLHALSMRKEKYIEKINRLLKGQYIVDVKYRVRKIDLQAKLERGEAFKIFEEKEEKITEYKTKDMSIEESIKYLSALAKKREQFLIKKGYKKCAECGSIFLGKEKLCSKCREEENLTINKY